MAAVISVAAAGKLGKPKIERFLMRFFRDVARAKAWKRRHGTSKGLIRIMTEQNPLTDLIMEEEQEYEVNMPAYSVEELLEFGDGQDGRPILIAILGRVYDVSSGAKFYGENGRYPYYAGRDITFALSTGCTTEECAETLTDPTQMSKGEAMEAKRWLSFFHLHDKYPLVGRLEDDPLDEILRDALSDQSAVNSAKFAGCGYVINRFDPDKDPDENLKVKDDMEEKEKDANVYPPEMDKSDSDFYDEEEDAYDGDEEEYVDYYDDDDDELEDDEEFATPSQQEASTDNTKDETATTATSKNDGETNETTDQSTDSAYSDNAGSSIKQPQQETVAA